MDRVAGGRRRQQRRRTRSGWARGTAGEGAAGEVPGVPERRGNRDRWATRARLVTRRGETGPRPPVRWQDVLG